MKKSITSILLFLLAINKVNAQGGCANVGNLITFVHNGTSYELVKEKKSWADAAACAKERGGVLARIDNAAEQNAIYNAVINAGVSPAYSIVADGGGTSYIWIGATDKKAEGMWIWDGDNDDTGTHFWQGKGALSGSGGTIIGGAYVNWGGMSTSGTANEPDDYNNNQDAAAMALGSWPASSPVKYGVAGEWNDINITNQCYYIIEKTQSSGIEAWQNNNKGIAIHIYPNPAKGFLYINNRESQAFTFSICSIYGQKIAEGSLPAAPGNAIINISGYAPGQYFLYLEGETGYQLTKKFTIAN